jgi:succinate-semialdehyde dehydrogenase / glutarate-semialdehyde dehydrogenase
MYPNVLLHIDGEWRPSRSGRTIDVLNPATEEKIGTVAHAGTEDLDEALASSARGFQTWRAVSAHDRSSLMRRAAELMRERADEIAPLLTAEQGKPLAEARGEAFGAAETIEWFAEEAPRAYGRVVPSRAPGVLNLVLREPVGPVAAFTPWNFPINQVVRKLGAALATGCSIIVKAPEETPASPAELIRAFVDAGLPPGVVNLVFGVPSEISEYLIPSPVIRKVTFTGSVPVGKHLAALAGQHMKRVTMELGGHSPAILFEDADLESAVRLLSAAKYRNAGQVCVNPTRFLIHESLYDGFVEKFVAQAKGVKVGDGMDEGTVMGPLAHDRRLPWIEGLVEDAAAHGAEVQLGGRRIGADGGYFYEPTVLTDVPTDTRAMNEEPFGPLALVRPFRTFEEAVTEANRLPYGLKAYAFTRSAKTANLIAGALETGMLGINQTGGAEIEMPFGGIKDSGYGSEGGSEAIDSYLVTKAVSQAGI